MLHHLYLHVTHNTLNDNCMLQDLFLWKQDLFLKKQDLFLWQAKQDLFPLKITPAATTIQHRSSLVRSSTTARRHHHLLLLLLSLIATCQLSNDCKRVSFGLFLGVIGGEHFRSNKWSSLVSRIILLLYTNILPALDSRHHL